MQAESIPSWKARAAVAVVGHDRLGMPGAVRVHVLDGVLVGVDDAHGEDQRQELLAPSRTRRPARPTGRSRRTRAIAAQLDAALAQRRERARQEGGGDVAMHEQRLGRVAHARPLHLGVDDDPLGHREIGGSVDVDVAVARGGVDHGHARHGADRLLQALAAARDDQVDDALELRELLELLAAAAGHERERALREPRALGRFARDPRQHGVRVRRRRGPAQQHRVAGLQAQRRGVDRHVRARLVDDRDHAQRDSNLAELEPVGQAAAVDDLADRIRQRRDRARAVGDPADAGLVEREPVHQARRTTRLRDRPRGHARWPRGSPASAPPARRRSRAAPRPWSPSRPWPTVVRRPWRRAPGR